MITENFIYLLSRRTSPTFVLKHDERVVASMHRWTPASAGYQMFDSLTGTRTPWFIRDATFHDWWLPKSDD